MAGKPTLVRREKQTRYQYVRSWLGRQDSNLGMAELKLPSRVCERKLSNDGAISAG
jgi:hypothetical protein